jgi:hypothetical protein
MPSTNPTVAKYLLELPPDRRPAIEAVRRTILAAIDRDIEETMSNGMIGYVVPHRVFPGGYHVDPKQPVPYLCLGSWKNHMAVYLMFAYTGGREEEWIRNQYAAKGKRLDMGKSCLRFKSLDEIDLQVLTESIRRVPAQQFIATYVATIGADRWRAVPAKPASRPSANPVFTAPAVPAAPSIFATPTAPPPPPAPSAAPAPVTAKKAAPKTKRKATPKAKKKAKKKAAARKPRKRSAAKKRPAARKKQPARKRKPATKK